jgi:hypothetical protein
VSDALFLQSEGELLRSRLQTSPRLLHTIPPQSIDDTIQPIAIPHYPRVVNLLPPKSIVGLAELDGDLEGEGVQVEQTHVLLEVEAVEGEAAAGSGLVLDETRPE